ncbi:hypothetical protein J7E79_25290 [Bacillus sp. ISL-40]|uniref:hypothetical protein n=1 Tax=unclassified Bacillus (in: firmicutes) TaxID=185979 RepID=UPI001BE9EF44|nr:MULTISPECIES: hypothetical protein [unclassified Bacillus (in: firmicutes)]MBT2700655.1 hypothetical protein [Bacillus sp. ISL-40]MBT2743356.1 hypothetical protein [Bacillus sp. ISL-77]
MCDELDPIELFFHQVIEFVESYTVFRNYKKMDEEKKTKYIEKLTLLIVFEASPRKNFDISMETIRLVVRDILEKKAAEVTDDE